MPAKLTPKQVGRLRLQAHGLVASGHEHPVAAVRAMLALQAQDFGASQWAVGVRVPGAARADVLTAYDAGEIVRSWPMRGTLHVTAAEDLGWMLGCTAERTVRGMARRHRELELDDATFIEAEQVARELLGEGGRATRAEFIEALGEAGISTEGQRAAHCIGYLAHTGVVCWGPMSGAQQQLVLLDEWVAKPRRLTGEDALAEFARRYFTGHGPATVEDFAWWTKLTLGDARAGLDAITDELVELRCGDATMWMTRDVHERCDPALPAASRSTLALPGFDEYLLGYRDRSHVLDPEYFDLVVPGGNGIFKAMIVSGGTIVGTWRRDGSRKVTRFEAEPFTDLSPATARGFDAATRRWLAFAGVE